MSDDTARLADLACEAAYEWYEGYRRTRPLPEGWSERVAAFEPHDIEFKNNTYGVELRLGDLEDESWEILDSWPRDSVRALVFRHDRQMVMEPEAIAILSELLPPDLIRPPSQVVEIINIDEADGLYTSEQVNIDSRPDGHYACQLFVQVVGAAFGETAINDR